MLVVCGLHKHSFNLGDRMWKWIFSLWIAMYGAIFISWLFNVKIILIRAFAIGIFTFVLTISYYIYCCYKEWKNPLEW